MEPLVTDDAYITFRYVEHIVDGDGFTYNSGEKVLGTTTPLFTVLLATLRPAVNDLGRLALIVGAAADAGTAVFLYLLVVRLTAQPFAALMSALAFSLSSGSVRVTIGAMETAVFTFLLLLGLWFALERRPVPFGAFGGLATLTRPEGVILLGLGLGWLTLRERRVPWRGCLSAGVVLLPWAVFTLWYFGSPVPHSAHAKGELYDFHGLYALKELLSYTLEYTLPAPSRWTASARYFLAPLLLSCFFVASFATYRREPAGLLFWLFPASYLCAYAVANPPIWIWYAVPLVPFAASAFVIATSVLFHRARNLVPYELSLAKTRALQAAAVAGVLLAGAYHLKSTLADAAAAWQDREARYFRVADVLARSDQGASSVAAPEIGVLGYRLSDVHIVDTNGLVTPGALPHHVRERRGRKSANNAEEWLVGGAIPVGLIEQTRPEFVVTRRFFAERLLQSDWFGTDYELFLKDPPSFSGGTGVLVFRKK